LFWNVAPECVLLKKIFRNDVPARSVTKIPLGIINLLLMLLLLLFPLTGIFHNEAHNAQGNSMKISAAETL
jgi:hypothetical protein